MKARIGQRSSGEQAASASRAKQEALGANGASAQQAAAQARKRRSSINVYDQPSSLNSRLRQLETDMSRLDEDRNRLVDETHAALAQYELKLSEIHAIIKSRQDNVERYVDDMRMLLQAKEEFEKQAKLLNEKHDRIQEKFMHRETVTSREIKLLKNKFDILEKNRQFRNMLQKSGAGDDAPLADDLQSGLDSSADGLSRKRSETGTNLTASELGSLGPGALDGERRPRAAVAAGASAGRKSVRIKMSKLAGLGQIFEPIFRITACRKQGGPGRRGRRRSNKVSSLASDGEPKEELKVAPQADDPVGLSHEDDVTAKSEATVVAMNGAARPADVSRQAKIGKKPSLVGRIFSKTR